MRLLIERADLADAATSAIKATAPGTAIESLAVRPVHNGSKQFVNDSTIDVCEVAVVTLLQAIAYNKPVVLLPITTLGRFQHQTLVTCRDVTIDRIRGKTVGVRSWSQTTGVWLRGFLTEEYGVDLRELDWVAFESGHVAEYEDPDWIRRAPEGSNLVAETLDATLDCAILGNDRPADDRVRSVIRNPDDRSAAWSRDCGFAPINHVIGVTVEAAHRNARVICTVYDALARAAETRAQGQTVVMEPFGFAGLRGPFSRAAKFAFEQQVLPRPVDFDEVVAQTCGALGVVESRLGG